MRPKPTGFGPRERPNVAATGISKEIQAVMFVMVRCTTLTRTTRKTRIHSGARTLAERARIASRANHCAAPLEDSAWARVKETPSTRNMDHDADSSKSFQPKMPRYGNSKTEAASSAGMTGFSPCTKSVNQETEVAPTIRRTLLSVRDRRPAPVGVRELSRGVIFFC